MTMTLEDLLRTSDQRFYGLDRQTLADALKAYGDQRFIEGATAALEAAADRMPKQPPHLSLIEYAAVIRSIDPNQLKDTDHVI